jgi:aspartate 1-decarboxylase
MLRSKIHRAVVTEARLDYEGSLTIPEDLLEASDIMEYEAVHVWNVSRGSRFETYAIKGERGTGAVCVNGAAAHLAGPGDIVIVATFARVPESQVTEHEPRIVFVDEKNRVVRSGVETPARKVSGC